MIRRQRIRRRVEALLGQIGLSKPPIDVHMVARSLGLQIAEAPNDDELSGFLLRQRNGGAIIGVNARHSLNRKRFTIAHEIGHFLLHEHANQVHVDSNKSFRVALRSPRSSTGEDVEEVEANTFAAELLMPASFLEHDLQSSEGLSKDGEEFVGALAKKYGVSVAAMSFRLVNLGVLM